MVMILSLVIARITILMQKKGMMSCMAPRGMMKSVAMTETIRFLEEKVMISLTVIEVQAMFVIYQVSLSAEQTKYLVVQATTYYFMALKRLARTGIEII